MRSGKRLQTRITGLLIVTCLIWLAFTQSPQFSRIAEQTKNLFSATEKEPVLEQTLYNPQVRFEDSTIANSNGAVLGLGNMFWEEEYYDLDCYQKKAGNGCDRAAGGKTIVLRNLMISKIHPGLEIFDGVSTVVKLTQEEKVYDPKTGKYKWEKVEESEPFKYCTGEKYESLAMISLGPISWPTTLMGQELSTFRATGPEGEPQYAVIDPTGRLFTEFKVDDILKFCSADDESRQYALRTIDTFNAKTPGYNQGDQMAYSILSLCNLSAPDGEQSSPQDREEIIKALWKTQDINVKTSSVMVEVENNLGVVEEKFWDEIQAKGKLNGIAPTGDLYIGMFAWQTAGAQYARIANSTAASKALYDSLVPPGFSIQDQKENRDVQPPEVESNTVINGPGVTMFHQFESSRPTIIGAITGGVYFMDDSVLSDDSNLAMLSWDFRKQDNDTFYCKSTGGGGKPNLKRCPVVRAIGGCSSDGFAQTDIRLRQLTLAAVNDTSRWAVVTDEDEVERTTMRTESNIATMVQAPDVYLNKASLDEVILTAGRAAFVCKPELEKRVAAQVTRITEYEAGELKKRLMTGSYRDQAILVTPVRVNYRAWALYDVNKDVQQDCQAWEDSHDGGNYRVVPKGACKKMDHDVNGAPDDNGWNTGMVEKWTNDNFKMKPALISFNIATYYRGQNMMSPSDPRYTGFKEDLKSSLEAQKIWEYPNVYIDCATSANGSFEYWLCREDDTSKLLPKCDDGSGPKP